MVTIIRAEVIHHGDWSELTKTHDVEVLNPHFAVSPKDDINIEYLIVRAERREEIKNFINDIKLHNKIIKILNYDIYRTIGYIIFIGKYSNSIKSIFMENMAIFKSAKFSDGVELFTFLMPFYNSTIIDKIKEKLNNISTLLKFNATKIQDNIINFPLLTKREREILLKAYQWGYFDYPRSVGLDELTKYFGISKTTLNYHLHNAIKKLIKYYLLDERDQLETS